ncbi:MAG: TetR/AcrR family transcriptional regulator [Elusimicrobia bacterium]|nr:TetR/AcrR family transcriptional regulator [Elusimicrobiota bacterium]
MSRPSRNQDKLLIQAGRKLLPETGISGLSVRKVAAEAGVNPGMFHYHFKTKRRFARMVLQEIYEEFFKGFSVESGGGSPPLERLRRALLALGRFARDNRRLFIILLHDVIEGEAEVTSFVTANFPRHIGILLGLIRECRGRGLLKKAPLPNTVAFLAGGAIAPNVGFGLLERVSSRKPLGLAMRFIEPMLVSDAAIASRVDWALAALAKEAA